MLFLYRVIYRKVYARVTWGCGFFIGPQASFSIENSGSHSAMEFLKDLSTLAMLLEIKY